MGEAKARKMAEVKLAERNNPAGEGCGRCRFYLGSDQAEIGWCRRNSPSAVFVGQFQQPPLANQAPIPIVRSFYPQVSVHSWCGEFKAGAPSQPIDFTQLSYGPGEHPLEQTQTEGEA